MAIQTSDTLAHAQLAAYETTIGTAPKLQIRSGSAPSNCAAADSGTLLAEITLPSDWMTTPASRATSKNGTWSGTGAAAGTAAHYRLKDSAATTCHEQGTVTATGGGGDLTLDNVSIASAQTVTITSWTRNMGNS